jgi:hypothetical protein
VEVSSGDVLCWCCCTFFFRNIILLNASTNYEVFKTVESNSKLVVEVVFFPKVTTIISAVIGFFNLTNWVVSRSGERELSSGIC